LLITNGKLVTWGGNARIVSDGALLIEGDRIAEIGRSKELLRKHSGAEVLDAAGMLVMPGNICAHTHFYGTFARGMAIPGEPPRDFPEILRRLWWQLDRVLAAEDVRYSALVCLLDAIKHGTTTLIDHHASPNALEGSLDVLASAVQQAGLRAVLCYEVSDRGGAENARAGIAENVRFIESARAGEWGERIGATFGLHASLSLSDATLAACRDAAPEGAGFHIHVAEHEADQQDSVQKSGVRVVERLLRCGILGAMTIAAHCVHIDVAEVKLLAQTGTWVTHQPRSNMNNAVGAADVEELLRKGVRVALGNDGFSNNMWAEWKTAYLLHKVWQRDPRRADGATIMEMAVRHSAALANQFFPAAPLGVLAAGAQADIVFVDYHPITPLTAANLPWHILFGFETSMVNTTICAGEVLMRNRELLTLDEAEITARSRELAAAAWKRFSD
jgi:putative selenium metabolism protein SsnA